MTSYKNVTKFKYTRNPAEVVSVTEYIIFEDAKEGAKYALLKFSNNLNQQLYGIKFEVYQYDAGGNLIAKTLAVHDKFTAAENEVFVPKAKLRLSENCATISVKLIEAKFDRIRWEKGEFIDNKYNFERYVQNANPVPAQKHTGGTQSVLSGGANRVSKNEPRKKSSAAFSVKSIGNRNKSVCPRVLAVIVTILLIAFSVGTSIYFKNTTNMRTVGDFDIRIISESEHTAGIVGYEGKKTELTIPARVGEYKITQIKTGAFRNSRVKNIIIESDGEITVEREAFAKSRVVSVYSDAVVRTTEKAFAGCAYLEKVELPNGVLSINLFSGSCSSSRKLEVNISGTLAFGTFGGGSKIKTLNVTCGNISQGALYGLNNANSITLNVRGILDRKFLELFSYGDYETVPENLREFSVSAGAGVPSSFYDGCDEAELAFKRN